MDSNVTEPINTTALFSVINYSTDLLFDFNFNEVAGATPTDTLGNAAFAGLNSDLTLDGSGNLQNDGSSSNSAMNITLGSSLSQGIHDLVLENVEFSNLTGQNQDAISMSFRVGSSGTQVGGSSKDRGWLRVGNLDGEGDDLDAEFGENSNDFNQILDFHPQSTISLTMRYDSISGDLFYSYDAGNGQVELAALDVSTGSSISRVGLGLNVDQNAGDLISVDRFTLSELIQSNEAPSTYTAWADANGIHGELPDADFNEDGINNLKSYAFDIYPALKIPNDSPFSVNTTSSGGKDFLVLTARENKQAADILIELQVSENLTDDWEVISVSDDALTKVVTDDDVDNDNTARLVEYTVDVTGLSKRFMRLLITLNN